MPSVSRSSLIGVAIACTGNVLISLALTIQKLAHRRQEEEHARSQTGHGAANDGDAEPVRSSRQRNVVRCGLGDVDEEETLIPVPVMILPKDGNNALGMSMDGRGESAIFAVDQGIWDGHVSPQPEPRRTSRGTSPRSPSPLRTARTQLGNIFAQSSEDSHPSNGGPVPKRDIDVGEDTAEEDNGGDDSQEEGTGGVEEGAYLRSRLWWLGQAMISIGEGGNFLSYAFAPASVVAPLGTVALVANCIFAPLILKERFQPKELIGMVLAILGAVTIVYASNDSNPRLDPRELVEAICQIPFIVYTAINIFLLIVLVMLSRSPRYGPKWIGVDVGICALFGGYTVLSTKAMASLLSTILFSAFEYPITWVLLLVLGMTTIAQVKYLNKALIRFQSKEVIPTQFVFFSLAAIIGSAVLYQEFRNISFSNFINFAFGILTTFLGVHLLTSLSSQQSSPSSTPDQRSPSQRSNIKVDLTPHPYARQSASENTPLLIPSTSPLPSRRTTAIPTSYRQAQPISEQAIMSTSAEPTVSPSLRGFRLLKRVSTGDFTPTLALNSQAGFLLLATTPPPTATASSRRNREQSLSRVERGRGDPAYEGRSSSVVEDA